jgi:hypothetical protein
MAARRGVGRDVVLDHRRRLRGPTIRNVMAATIATVINANAMNVMNMFTTAG